MGTLIQKIQCHERPLTTAPPTSGPLATASPVMALKMPMAAPRRSGGKASDSRARPSGIRSADPAPCTARAAMRVSTFGARAQAAEASAKTTRPVAKPFLLPKRSPRPAAGMSSTAKLRL